MSKENLKRLIKLSKGEIDAPLVLKNAKIVNVFTNEIIEDDVAIADGTIVGIGDYRGDEEIDLEGRYLAPGFIDSHVHIESSMSSPSQFARVVVPRGVTTVIADPHEIANVKGLEGIEYIIKESQNLPLDVKVMLPSCVPSTKFENAGATLQAEDLATLKDKEEVLGLGEVMSYPDVIAGDDGILDKLVMFKDSVIDGHGPVIKGKDLNAYRIAGIDTEHECSTIEEVIDRVRLGMYILVREGSAAKDLRNIIEAVNKDNLRRFLFCTDDKHPEDLVTEGSIDFNIKLAIRADINPIDAIKMATLNSAECYGLKDKGAIAPGYRADLVVIDDLEDFNVLEVFKDGKLVGKDRKALFEAQEYLPENMTDSVNLKGIQEEDIQIEFEEDEARVITVGAGSLVTEKNIRKVHVKDGKFAFSDDGILKLIVAERHKATGNIGVGLIENIGLKGGAIGTTVGHDSHNLIAVGDSDRDIVLAAKELEKIGGGLVIVEDGQVIKTLPLEIGGIMTSKSIDKTIAELKEMIDISYDRLGVNKDIDPFMTLSFMALPVIPSLKLTDMGLFDVDRFEFTPIEA